MIEGSGSYLGECVCSLSSSPFRLLSSILTPPPPFHSMIWNVMGHDDQCCNYVKHSDGYSLYYPNGNSPADQANILQIVKHWYKVTGRTQPSKLPAVACPQPVF
jgi:mannan endo-1,4-beta-mannosidase